MASIPDRIAFFKQSENSSQIVPLIQDVQLQSFVAVWPQAMVEPETTEIDAEASWRELWKCFYVSPLFLSKMLGLSQRTAQALLHKALAAQLIYPDGTVHGGARKYLTVVANEPFEQALLKARKYQELTEENKRLNERLKTLLKQKEVANE